MRVISGEFRGRRLQAVPGSKTRPTTDKVKESMFNIIGPYFEAGLALDLFAGTGGLGLESLSRGMDKCIFIEMDVKAFRTVRDNVKTLGLDRDRAEVFKNEARKALEQLADRELRFDLVFLDPPYHKIELYEQVMTKLIDSNLLADDAYVVAEHAADVELPDTYGKAKRWRQAQYGDIAISFYRFDADDEEGMTQA
ncbi:MAG TPA: 16S rRNA (guanine(966)-N(2))-methyltransferase RsmD [Bacilli bacterium]|nr:16S rRNA (guanine(966)-N(2))-methyltransferase RsmD [Bacilli bacterium]